jgi:hypothetical protein
MAFIVAVLRTMETNEWISAGSPVRTPDHLVRRQGVQMNEFK